VAVAVSHTGNHSTFTGTYIEITSEATSADGR
jgi:hypothetical protein